MENVIDVLEYAIIVKTGYSREVMRKMTQALKRLKQKRHMLLHGTPAQVREVLASKIVTKEVNNLLNKTDVIWIPPRGRGSHHHSIPYVPNQPLQCGDNIVTED